MSDLGWLRERGLAAGVTAHAAAGTAGARHLRRLSDALHAHRRPGGIQAGSWRVWACSTPTSRSRRRRPCGTGRLRLHGYEIHHGQVARRAEDDWLGIGIRRGHVYGTHWHGLLDNDSLRRQWLADAAAAAAGDGFVVADDVDVAARRDAQLDLMADC